MGVDQCCDCDGDNIDCPCTVRAYINGELVTYEDLYN